MIFPSGLSTFDFRVAQGGWAGAESAKVRPWHQRLCHIHATTTQPENQKLTGQ
jgi:hypothetical protein